MHQNDYKRGIYVHLLGIVLSIYCFIGMSKSTNGYNFIIIHIELAGVQSRETDRHSEIF